MHTFLVVLLRPDAADINTAVKAAMAPYEIKEDRYDEFEHLSDAAFHAMLAQEKAEGRRQEKWDYWTYKPDWNGQAISIPATLASWEVAESEAEIRNSVCPVALLPPDFQTGGIVTPDGTWHEPEDFGWRMLNAPDINRQALERWRIQQNQLLHNYNDCLAIALDAHS